MFLNSLKWEFMFIYALFRNKNFTLDEFVSSDTIQNLSIYLEKENKNYCIFCFFIQVRIFKAENIPINMANLEMFQ